MAENKAEVLAGAAVLAAAVAFMVYASAGSGFGPQADSYPLRASFRSVEGITAGSDVRLAGVKVGTITALTLNPATFFADATILVDQAVQLPADSQIVISSSGLLGSNFVELIPGGALENLAPGDEIEDTQGAVSLIGLLMKFVTGKSDSADSGAAP